MILADAAPAGNSADGPAAQFDAKCAIRRELTRIVDLFDAADRRAKAAATVADREEAEWERMEAAGEFWGAEEALADLCLLLIRQAAKHRPDELRTHLLAVLAPVMDELAEAVARLEGGR